ncbi:MAG: ABC transporter substrate-binding protein [Thermomicrobiales bacterium]|nr:ABC transporter substrate-binding protein [Thermomicrobiales bacterium]
MDDLLRARIGRRTLLAGSAAASLAIVSGVHAQGDAPASPAADGWSFTDLLGNTIELPERPVRIAAAINTAGALNDFGIPPTTVFGWTASNYPDGDHVAWGSLDPSTVEIVSDIEGNVDVEALLAAEPDLIVTWIWNRDDPATSMVGIPAEVTEAIESIAPIVIINQGDSNEIELGRIIELAVALGADLRSEQLIEDRHAFEGRYVEANTIAAEKSDLTVLFASYNPGEFYVASPDYVGDLGFVRTLGFNLANDGSPEATTYWEPISEEQALKYPADVIYIDAYGAWTTLEELQAHPTLSTHPAVAAGQVGIWNRDLPLSFVGQARFIEEVLAPIRDAEKVS